MCFLERLRCQGIDNHCLLQVKARLSLCILAAGTEVVSKAALSNTLGGIGYFFGSTEVKLSDQGDRVVKSWPAALFTAVPSRSFFPRGFIWDEGFHQVPYQILQFCV
jgi:hypothetical protein